MSEPRPGSAPTRLTVNVVEINPHAPRPYVFTETALCVQESLQRAGFLSNLHVNQADPQSLSIVLGAVPPLHGPLEQLDPRKTILFNLEQLASDSALAGTDYRRWLRKWLVVDYHSANVDHLKRENGSAQEVLELPLVPGKSVASGFEPAQGKSVDVLFFGTLTERRSRIIERLDQAGISVETVAGSYANELAPAIRRARIVLHVHFYSTGLFPVARFLQPVASGVPIVCESSVVSRLSDWRQSGILFADYDALVDACAQLLRSPSERQERADSTQRFAADLDFATPFALVLDAVAARLARPRDLVPVNAAPPLPDPDASHEPLTDAEIEALLQRETGALAPESHVQPPPLRMVERQLGQGRFGVWAVWLMVLFSLWTIWQSMH
ncbi:MAG: hypothetical protein NVS3B2_07200 [Ramlibacter sp.]